MKRVRLGNDIPFVWNITRNGTPEDFEGKQVSVYIRHDRGEKIEVDELAYADGSISGIFRGKVQRYFGNYSLVLVENRGGNNMFSVDAIGFVSLVHHTADKGGTDQSGVVTETVSIESEITVPSNGVGISGIVHTASSDDDGINYITINLDNGSSHTFEVKNGSKGTDADIQGCLDAIANANDATSACNEIAKALGTSIVTGTIDSWKGKKLPSSVVFVGDINLPITAGQSICFDGNNVSQISFADGTDYPETPALNYTYICEEDTTITRITVTNTSEDAITETYKLYTLWSC